MTTVLLAFATSSVASRATTFLALFFAQAVSWAGIPALGAAAAGAAGVLASQGTVHLWAVLVVGTAGAEVGGVIGWALGRKLSRAGLDGDGRFTDRRRRALDSAARVEAKWGRLIVLFVPSWVSGAMGMSLRRFALWNLVGATLANVSAGLASYGVTAAATNKSATHSLLPIVIAVLVVIAGGVLFSRHRHRSAAAASEEA